MKKSEFIAKFAERTEYSKVACETIFNCFTDIITNELKSGGEISLPAVGKLKVRQTKARSGRNPKTGEQIQIPAGKKVVFITAKELKENL